MGMVAPVRKKAKLIDYSGKLPSEPVKKNPNFAACDYTATQYLRAILKTYSKRLTNINFRDSHCCNSRIRSSVLSWKHP